MEVLKNVYKVYLSSYFLKMILKLNIVSSQLWYWEHVLEENMQARFKKN